MVETMNVTLIGGPHDGHVMPWPGDDPLIICAGPTMTPQEFLAAHEGRDAAAAAAVAEPVKQIEYAYRRDETSPHRFLYVGERQAEDPRSAPIA